MSGIAFQIPAYSYYVCHDAAEAYHSQKTAVYTNFYARNFILLVWICRKSMATSAIFKRLPDF